MKSFDYISELKNKTGYSSYKLSEVSGISQSALSQYLNEGRIMDDFACFKIADMLGIDPKIIIAKANVEREKDVEKNEFWQGKVKEYGFISVSYAVLLSFSSFIVGNIVYILC